MLGYFAIKRLYKPYFIIPLFLYACVMYRMLGGTCGLVDNKKSQRVLDATNSISYKTNRNENLTATLTKLAKEYQIIERRRQLILNSLRHVVDSTESRDNTDSIPLNTFKRIYNNKDLDVKGLYDRQRKFQNQMKSEYTITCANIHEANIKAQIGHGVSKQTYSADFRGRQVAVKMVTRHQSEVKPCLDKINASDTNVVTERARCFTQSNMKVMKEILLLEQLRHPGFVRLLGYCVRNEESDTTDLTERGIVSVYELGTRISVYSLQTLPWQQRLQISMELAEFLHYLEFSPLGSLRIRDFKQDHFLMVNGSVKMIDLDDVDNLEPSCSVYISVEAQAEMAKEGKSNGCEFNLPCQKGLCIGFNAIKNMAKMNALMLKHLLFPITFPKEIQSELGELSADLDGGHVTALMLVSRIEQLQTLLNSINT